ncbi:dicarboxylate/amino acid:cation symporter [Salinibacillus xinjiangensis]|uniref:Cation:dicarboxylase symporter family transporter n=1 Tax=Salinibacillus xinjiangensis TaxID=1229268 RepID=A0A6G1X1T9_9BACI|nr:dicarboxylate/amino acid:cation symporter [Salinibacillus xinjiangensis]MRG84951.1 cation:dicarboxylase symporter family transporter [Salinibacillus xinjiangensis]
MKLKNNLVTQMLIAFILAILVGLVFGQNAEYVQPLGDLFLRLIKFIMIPLILSTLIVGVASTGDMKVLGKLGGKTVVYFLCTTMFAITIGMAVAYIFQPGNGVTLEATGETVEPNETGGVLETLLNIIPTNPINSLVEGNILQIIFFAIFIGIGITKLGSKAAPVKNFFDSFAEIMYSITNAVIKVAPIGIFGLIAPVVGINGPSVLLPLIKVLLAMAVAALLHIAIVYSIAVSKFGKMSPVTFFKGISPAALVAFSTCSSSGTLPVTMKNVEENLNVPKKVSSFVLPLGATINMDGTAIYHGIAALFIAQVYGLDLSFLQYLTIVLTAVLSSIGAAGVPGAGMIILSMVLASVNLPLEGIALIAGIDRILDMFRTSTNVIGDSSAAVILSKSERTTDEDVYVNSQGVVG